MPRKYELHWFDPQGRKTGKWRKRYENETFCITFECNGKHFQQGHSSRLALH